MTARKIRILFGWDLIISGALAGFAIWLGPESVDAGFAKDMYGLGASVLSVVFSVFIAALAMIMSTSSDDFVELLKRMGTYDVTVFGFRFTLWLLFLGLMAAVVLYALTSWQVAGGVRTRDTKLVAGFVFILLWGVSSTLNAALVAVTHSKLHVQYNNLSEAERFWVDEGLKPSGRDSEADRHLLGE